MEPSDNNEEPGFRPAICAATGAAHHPEPARGGFFPVRSDRPHGRNGQRAMPPSPTTSIDPTDLLTAIARGAEKMSRRNSWPDGVNELLAELGRATLVSRVWVFQTVELGPSHIVQDYIFEWAANPKYVQIGMPSFSMFRTGFDLPVYRSIVQSRLKGKHQAILPREMPDCWLRDDLLHQQKVQSMLTIPIMVDGLWWGTLGFDDCEREYRWSRSEVALLRTASALITSAILREQLAAREQQFEILKSLTDSSAWQVDLKTGRGWVTGDLAKIPGQAPATRKLNLRGLLRLLHPADMPAFTRAVRTFITLGGRGTFRFDVRLRHQEGDPLWVEIIGCLNHDPKGRPEQMAGIAVDIRHRKHQEIVLRRMAETDSLTGAVNRRAFEDHLDYQLARAERKDRPLSMLMLDLDHFKKVNDVWGHPVGDKVLKAFAEICRANLRDNDVLARMGGEEFALLLPGANADAAGAVGERIRRMLEQARLETHQDLRTTVSVGCATCSGGASTAKALVAAADSALYEAKRAGRNRLVQAKPPRGC